MSQASYSARTFSVDLNETWSIQSGRSNSVIRLVNLISPLDQSGNGQPICKTRLEGKASHEMRLSSHSGHVRDCDRQWHIRPREVHYRVCSRADRSGHGEFQRLILRLGRRDDGQWAKCGQVDIGQRLRA